MRRLNAFAFFAVLLVLLLVYVGTGHFGLGKQVKGKSPYALLVSSHLLAQETLEERVEALGTATANESVEITASVTAKVRAVHFEDGQTVERAAELVELDDDAARADMDRARVNLAEEERQLRHLQALIDRKAISRTDVEKQQSVVNAARADYEAHAARLDDYSVRAPFAGVLGIRRVSVGALVSPGTTITTLDDLARIKVDFTVPEIYLPLLHQGLVVEARSPAWPEKAFAGVVTFVDNRVDPLTRAVALRAMLDNPEHLLRPGMLLTIEIRRPPRQTLMVPERSIAPLRGEQYVFVIEQDAEGKTVARQRIVQLGQRSEGKVEVLKGLSPGERIVVDGSMSAQDGMQVTVQDGK